MLDQPTQQFSVPHRRPTGGKPVVTAFTSAISGLVQKKHATSAAAL